MSYGLLTKIWGPPMWESIHAITFNYPENPTEDDIKHYRDVLYNFGYVLPCSYCSKSYNEYIKNSSVALTPERMKNRDTLTRWGYDLHNIVNAKLGVTYDITYEEVKEKYESYRFKCSPTDDMKCVMTAKEKSECYKKKEERHAPVINIKIIECFVEYAEKRGVSFNYKYYRDIRNSAKENNQHICQNKNWIKRNRECCEKIREMRINGIPQLECSGEFIGLPTKDELYLLERLSTSMSTGELMQLCKKLNHNIEIEFTLTCSGHICK